QAGRQRVDHDRLIVEDQYPKHGVNIVPIWRRQGAAARRHVRKTEGVGFTAASPPTSSRKPVTRRIDVLEGSLGDLRSQSGAPACPGLSPGPCAETTAQPAAARRAPALPRSLARTSCPGPR